MFTVNSIKCNFHFMQVYPFKTCGILTVMTSESASVSAGVTNLFESESYFLVQVHAKGY